MISLISSKDLTNKMMSNKKREVSLLLSKYCNVTVISGHTVFSVIFLVLKKVTY